MDIQGLHGIDEDKLKSHAISLVNSPFNAISSFLTSVAQNAYIQNIT